MRALLLKNSFSSLCNSHRALRLTTIWGILFAVPFFCFLLGICYHQSSAEIGKTFAAMNETWLPSIFSDNMVLQRDIPICIWGKAPPGSNIKLTLGKAECDTIAGADGKWLAKFPPMSAGGPYDLIVKSERTIIFHNVAIGDVWFCAGQSNMKMPLLITSHSKEDVETANYPNLRFFHICEHKSVEPEKDVIGKWKITSPKNVLNFSATAYYFAREIHKKTKIPVAVVECTSGEPIPLWTSHGPIKSSKNSTDQQVATIYNGMIAPLSDYGIKGVVWYKGETDKADAIKHQKLLSQLVQDWRNNWRLGNFPFLCVQLPNYASVYNNTEDSTFAQIREAQLQCSKCLPNFYLIVTIDTAEKGADIHPREKSKIGQRIAETCISKIYERNNNATVPACKYVDYLDDKVIVHFDSNELTVKNNPLRGFVLAGSDQLFYKANAQLSESGSEVVVSSYKVRQPVALRYAWADNPECNLYGKNGLPVSPFRTDSWRPASVSSAPKSSYWVRKSYLAEPNPPDIVILGNEQVLSLLGADIGIYDADVDFAGDHRSHVIEYDLAQLLNENLRVIVTALPGAMVSDQLIISHALFLDSYKPKLVAVAISPLNFMDANCSLVDETEPFNFFLKDIVFDFDLLFRQLNLLSTWYERASTFFMRKNDICEVKFKPDCDQGQFSPLTWSNPYRPIYPGQLVIKPENSYWFSENLDKYRAKYKNCFSPQVKIQMRLFDDLLEYLAHRHIKTVIFDLPLSKANKELLPKNFWTYYQSSIDKICKKYDVDYIRADQVVLPFEKNELFDSAHLNLMGGLRWSRPTAFYIANKFRKKSFQELLPLSKQLK